MRWLLPAGVVVTALGGLTLYVPLGGKFAALTPIALISVGTVGMAVGVVRAWRPRLKQGGERAARTGRERAADIAAPTGLVIAIVAVLALGSVMVVEPIVVSLAGPDPCKPLTGAPGYQPDFSCFAAHPDYYQYDPSGPSWSTPESRISRTFLPVAWTAAPPLALGAVLLSWVALAMGTRRRRIAISALTLSFLIIIYIVVVVFGLALGGGD